MDETEEISEQEVVYEHEGRLRVLRGRVKLEPPWVVVRRRDGTYRIAERTVTAILPLDKREGRE